MQIQMNTGHNIKADEALRTEVRGTVQSVLGQFFKHIRRVDVHLSDVNTTADKHCRMEVRLEGRRPMAVTYRAASCSHAVDGAAGKLTRLIEKALGGAVSNR